MWTTRYFNPRYWAERYWAKVGSDQLHVVSAHVLKAPARAELYMPVRRRLSVWARAELHMPARRRLSVPNRGTHG